MNKVIFVFFLLAGSALLAQSGTIFGVITNEQGEPLVGANVFLKNTALGAASEEYGYYTMKSNSNILLLPQ